jgi:CRP-like cAMP-binding protein
MNRKLNRPDDAVAAWTRAADRFAASGFLLKAIAVCKLILEVDPDHQDTQTKLAGLYSARGAPPRPKAQGPAPPTQPPQAKVAPAPAPVAAPAPIIPPPPVSAPPEPRKRTLPPGATLDQISVGRVVEGARPSGEVPLLDEPNVFEIPLDADELEFLEESRTTIAPGATPPPAPAQAAPPPPSPAQSAAMAIFPKTPLFSSLDAASLKLLIERVKLVRLDAGQDLFKQGDPGDALYVVSEGEVAAVVDGREVGRLPEGSFFGEIAIVTEQPRSATIRAVASSDVLAIDRVTISDLIEASPDVLKTLLRFMRDRLLDTLIATNRLFAPFSGEDRRTLAGRFKFLEVEAGAKLVDQGKRAPGLFVILAGRVDVLLDGKTIANLSAGDLFGEMSLLHGAAVASIVATARSYLIQLPRSDFQEVIMTHPQVLEYIGTLAEERRKQIEAIKNGSARYGEGRLPVV